MKAIVMAGGEGTRLRPLTSTRPKPMAEFFGKSLLEHAVEKLKRLGIRDICFTLRYLPEKIMESFGDGERLGVSITHRVEREPLGTAGGVRACRDFIGDEDVLILSGDAVWDFDLGPVLRFHREKGADATVVLYAHQDPTSFGLVLTDGEGRVTAFSEKPPWERVVTDRINTGIYVLTPPAVDLIPENTSYDFGKDLFPRLVREGYRVYGAGVEGYWCDVGSAPAYLRCHIDALSKRVDIDTGENAAAQLRGSGVTLRAPVFVSPDARVEAGAVIGPNAVLGPGTTVGEGARVEESVLNGARVGAGSEVRGAILCRDVKLGKNVKIAPGAVLGDGCVLGDGAVVAENVLIFPGKTVRAGAAVTKSLTDREEERPIIFTDDRRMTADAASLLDAAIVLGAALGRGARVALAHTGGAQARLIADAIACGVTAAGGEAALADCDFEAELASLSPVFAFERCVFVRAAGEVTVTVLGRSGVPLEPAERRRVEAALKEGQSPPAAEVGPVDTISGSARAYVSAACADIRALSPAGRPVRAAVTGKGAENRALKCVLAALDHEVAHSGVNIPSLAVGVGGFGFTAKDERGRPVDAKRAALLAAEAAMRLGLDAVAVTPEEPEALRRLAVKYGCAVLESGTPEGRELYARQRFLRDGVLAAALVVSAMARDGVEMATLLDSLPDFAVAERSVRVSLSRAAAMRKLTEDNPELRADTVRGLVCATPHGGVNIRPDARRNALVFRAEAESMEAARELLDKFTPPTRE